MTLSSTFTKNHKTAVQPLPAELTPILREYLDGKAADSPIWPGTWHERTADMLRIELDICGIPYIIQGPDGPLFADFHCLRHSFVALLDKRGATLKEAMQLARHNDPKLTMAVYGRARLQDLAGAVDRMPTTLAGTESSEMPQTEILRATGTDCLAISCAPYEQASANMTTHGHKDTFRVFEGNNMQGIAVTTEKHASADMIIPEQEWAHLDSNQEPRDYESYTPC